jgi:membrane-associated phospholipid phosphatase
VSLRVARLHSVLLAAATLCTGVGAYAQARDPSGDATTAAPPAPAPQSAAQGEADNALATDIKLYFTAPLRWDGADWAWFGGTLVAIGASHHYDTQVRTHFIKTLGSSPTSSKDVQDALPAAAVLVGTWGYAGLIDDSAGRREAWAMLEAAGLGSVTAYALKYTVRREGPDQSSDPNQWEKSGGNSFPSWHATAAFAVGTVLAESGNDEYRWLRRLLGYGLGAGTSYERLKHNAHWLSDTVAGSALGMASAHFVMNRAARADDAPEWGVVPVAGGAMLTYSLTLP